VLASDPDLLKIQIAAIVRHKLGCPTLLAQTRTRWPAQVR
jgi:hypothetical protein